MKAGLALAEKPPLKPFTLENAPDGTVFEMPPLTGSWARCLEGLRHPYTGKLRPITFDHDVAENRDDVVLVHMNHRLVQMCLRLMRAEVWATDDVKRLHRVDVRSLPNDVLATPAAVVVSRLVITGGNHHRLHEELTVSGGYLRDNGYAREARVTQINEWLDRAQPLASKAPAFSQMARRFRNHEDLVLQTVEARSRDRLRNLENTLNTRKSQEIKNIETVLDELARAIESELKKDTQPQQLSLFSEDERLQVRRDSDALRARLARIPDEKLQEVTAIEQRYEGFAARTFPVAVILLVPNSEIEEAGQ